jgi:hypothetical protein
MIREISEMLYDQALRTTPLIWLGKGFLVSKPSPSRRCQVTGRINLRSVLQFIWPLL